MSALSDADRIRLASTSARLNLDHDRQHSARCTADFLRTELPDLDDVTIGRVLMQVGQLGADVSVLNPLLGVAPFSVSLAAAALELTRTEWQDAPR